MRDVDLGARIFAVEVAVVRQQFGGGNFPRMLVFFTVLPPGNAVGEFFETHRLRFAVALSPFRQWLLVIPNIGRWS
jgi:hypothetical protein